MNECDYSLVYTLTISGNEQAIYRKKKPIIAKASSYELVLTSFRSRCGVSDNWSVANYTSVSLVPPAMWEERNGLVSQRSTPGHFPSHTAWVQGYTSVEKGTLEGAVLCVTLAFSFTFLGLTSIFVLTFCLSGKLYSVTTLSPHEYTLITSTYQTVATYSLKSNTHMNNKYLWIISK